MTAFSRQHFKIFAELIKKMQNRKEQETLAIELLKMFKADNPRFDSAKFLQAAGIESNTRTAPFEHTSPTGGKTAFATPLKEAFEGFSSTKITPLLPVGLTAGGGLTYVKESTLDNLADYEDFRDDYVDKFEEVEDEVLDKAIELTDQLASAAESIRFPSLKNASNSLYKSLAGSFRDFRKTMHTELDIKLEKEVKGKTKKIDDTSKVSKKKSVRDLSYHPTNARITGR